MASYTIRNREEDNAYSFGLFRSVCFLFFSEFLDLNLMTLLRECFIIFPCLKMSSTRQQKHTIPQTEFSLLFASAEEKSRAMNLARALDSMLN
jgi:hypothetical protein